ncbi:hypothetical protein CES85_3589 (plasmid) [Ochrobactrum quorumnocens]|uniref:Uncharacterized protein n=1 Tax=Ochrobactrum quorumnocens TaxID=271865 RepID=A0A248UPN3_9HYPH|nr:hypothetical protein CES85_3589 [[Ochrobactrum] quorumnocens]
MSSASTYRTIMSIEPEFIDIVFLRQVEFSNAEQANWSDASVD